MNTDKTLCGKIFINLPAQCFKYVPSAVTQRRSVAQNPHRGAGGGARILTGVHRAARMLLTHGVLKRGRKSSTSQRRSRIHAERAAGLIRHTRHLTDRGLFRMRVDGTGPRVGTGGERFHGDGIEIQRELFDHDGSPRVELKRSNVDRELTPEQY